MALGEGAIWELFISQVDVLGLWTQPEAGAKAQGQEWKNWELTLAGT